MKKTFFLITAAITLIGCNNRISQEAIDAFKGEYWMETQTYWMLGDQVIDQVSHSVWSPVSIYDEDGKLFVQTEMLGPLNIDGVNAQEIQAYREKPDYLPMRTLRGVFYEEEPESQNDTTQGIEVVDINNNNVIFVRDGYILMMKNGIIPRTLPIQVKSGSKTVLNLCEYTPIDIVLTDKDGTMLATVRARYIYGPMIKKSDCITWDVELTDDHNLISSDSPDYDRVIHRNTLYRK